ncbi:MAG: translation initiation factor [Tannerellaceae bacterium]|jgi:translation initiation factor 1|nr:translation initiation factor [Tannerellaceae bacterium]
MSIVYSTNPEFRYNPEQDEEETLPNEKQLLRVTLDKRNRKGKTVTLITGFRGQLYDLEILGKWLKGKCGTGGSVKDGDILIQGDMRRKVVSLLMESGYTKSKLC